MRQIVCLLLGLLIGFGATAQEVDVKKKSVYVNGIEELNLDGKYKLEGTTTIVSSLKSNQPLFSMFFAYHDGYYNVDISFIDFDHELRVKVINYKKLFKNMYQLKVIDENGKINEENAKKFSRLYDTNRAEKVIITDG